MICANRNLNNQKVIAYKTLKNEGPFYCPICKEAVILRKGTIKVHHFAHRPPVKCKYGMGEKEIHRKIKTSIYEELMKNSQIKKCELERNLGDLIPDISYMINNTYIAIEVQISNLSINEIISRTKKYANKNIHVLWLSDFNSKLEHEAYSLKAWEKWVHATYYGRVYYWIDKLNLIPIHFSDYYNYIEAKEWYNQYGDLQTAGGYHIISKRYKIPKKGNIVNIIDDFKPKLKEAWSGGYINTPECKIIIDKNQKWW